MNTKEIIKMLRLQIKEINATVLENKNLTAEEIIELKEKKKAIQAAVKEIQRLANIEASIKEIYDTLI